MTRFERPRECDGSWLEAKRTFVSQQYTGLDGARGRPLDVSTACFSAAAPTVRGISEMRDAKARPQEWLENPAAGHTVSLLVGSAMNAAPRYGEA